VLSRHGVRIDHLLSQAAGRRSNRETWSLSASLTRPVTDIADRVAYVYGPLGMIRAVRGSLETIGIPGDRIRAEVFRLQ